MGNVLGFQPMYLLVTFIVWAVIFVTVIRQHTGLGYRVASICVIAVLLEKLVELVDIELGMCPEMCPSFITEDIHDNFFLPYRSVSVSLNTWIFALEGVTLLWWVLIRKPEAMPLHDNPTPAPPAPPAVPHTVPLRDDGAAHLHLRKKIQPKMEPPTSTPTSKGWGMTGNTISYGSGSYNRFTIDNRTMHMSAAAEQDPYTETAADFNA